MSKSDIENTLLSNLDVLVDWTNKLPNDPMTPLLVNVIDIAQNVAIRSMAPGNNEIQPGLLKVNTAVQKLVDIYNRPADNGKG